MPPELKAYKNVMETFVDEEIKDQMQKNKTLSQMSEYVNLLEVAAFALNRLPAYYASSLEGIERQRRRIKEQRELRQKIAFAVAQAFAAVGRDPIRRSTPIVAEQKDMIQEAKQTLSEVEDILPTMELSWIVSFMETFLINLKYKQLTTEEVVKLYYLLYYYWQESQDS